MTSSHPHAAAGFTLIELMITLAILSILLLLGTSLTTAWMDQAKIQKAINATNQTMLQARALAIRNTNNQTISTTLPATAVCLSSSALVVYQVVQGSSSPCSTANTVVKTLSLPSSISLYTGSSSSTAFVCTAFNAAGIMITTANSCVVTSTYTVVSNNETQTFSID